MIFRMHLGNHHPLNLVPLAYIHWFTRPLPQPEKNLKMYFVKRLLRNDQSPVTDIIDMESIARFIQVIPKFPGNTKELANSDADLIAVFTRLETVNLKFPLNLSPLCRATDGVLNATKIIFQFPFTGASCWHLSLNEFRLYIRAGRSDLSPYRKENN
jgi:hypothetical protein